MLKELYVRGLKRHYITIEKTSEMREVKHYYQKGILARNSIDK